MAKVFAYPSKYFQRNKQDIHEHKVKCYLINKYLIRFFSYSIFASNLSSSISSVFLDATVFLKEFALLSMIRSLLSSASMLYFTTSFFKFEMQDSMRLFFCLTASMSSISFFFLFVHLVSHFPLSLVASRAA